MKLERRALLNCLTKAYRALAKQRHVPILENYFFRVADHRLLIHGSCVDWGITLGLDAEYEDVSFVVPPTLLDVVKSLDCDTISLKPDLVDYQLVITFPNGSMSLRILSSEDFPEMPPVTGQSFTIDSKRFQELVDVGAACATRSMKRMTDNVYVEHKDGVLSVVSTDQFSLSCASEEIGSPTTDWAFNIPANTLQDALRCMDGALTITVGDKAVLFECESASANMRLVDGQYFQYRQIIPKRYVSAFTCNGDSLGTTLARIAVLQAQDNAMTLQVVDPMDTIVLESSSHLGSVKEDIVADVQAKGPFHFWCQHTYLSRAVKTLASETITFELSGDLKPIRVTGKGIGFFLLMPMQQPRRAYIP